MEKKVLVTPKETLEGELRAELELVAGLPKDKAAAMASMLMSGVSIGRFFLPDPLLASFEAEVGSVFGHYTEDPKGDQVELKIVAIPDGLEGEQIEKGKEYHVLILASTDKSRCKRDEGSEVKK